MAANGERGRGDVHGRIGHETELMRTGLRRREILRRVFLTGYVEARQLAEELGVDGSTIRRDFDALTREGHLQRTHGGARAQAGAIDIPYAVKRGQNQRAKDAVANLASQLIQNGDSVILDAGSTTCQLALTLADRRNLTIVTNDLLIGQTVADYPGVRLLVTGGELLTSTYTLLGERAVAFVEDLRVDWTFLGADAIDLESGITNTNALEVPLKRAMLAAAHTSVVLADSSKFGKHALIRVAGVDEIDTIISDEALDDDVAQSYRARLKLARYPVSEGAGLAGTVIG